MALDKRAFAQIYEANSAPIYRFVLFKVREREVAQDITQNVFLRVWSAMESYDERGLPITAWLYIIARNLCFDYFKKLRDARLPLQDGAEIEIWDETQDTSRMAVDRERYQELALAVARLSQNEQEVLVMRHMDGKSYGEIGVILGKSEEALRATHMRAIKRLRKELRKYYEE